MGVSLGFTGTRAGLTNHQTIALVYVLSRLEKQLIGIHHGDCVGADDQFHDICVRCGFYDLIESHPCNLEKQRAFNKAPKIHKPKPPLNRNRDIVLASDLLFVCPKEDNEIIRSGTWATYRESIRQKKSSIMFPPAGGFIKRVVENQDLLEPTAVVKVRQATTLVKKPAVQNNTTQPF